MRTRHYTTDDVEHFAQYIAPLCFNPDATRDLHFQACSFFWSDEMPEFVDDDYDASLRHFMVWLFSYRKMLMYGEAVAEFEPMWDRLSDLCPHWPGFRLERREPRLIPALESEVERELNRLEHVLNVRQRRAANRKRPAQGAANQPRGDGEIS